MKKLKVYLDTSVINFVYADDAPDFKKATVEFFARYSLQYDLYISNVVMAELSRDPDAAHRAKLLAVIKAHPITLIGEERWADVRELAATYLERGLFPANKEEDAMHAAYATVHQLDVLLSWNFKHLANVRKEATIQAVTLELGYRYPLRIVAPLEVEYE